MIICISCARLTTVVCFGCLFCFSSCTASIELILCIERIIEQNPIEVREGDFLIQCFTMIEIFQFKMPAFLEATLSVANAQAVLARFQPVSINEVKAPDAKFPRLYGVRAVFYTLHSQQKKSNTLSRRNRWVRAFEEWRSKNTTGTLFLACRTPPPWLACLQPTASNQDFFSDMLLF